MNPTGIPTDWLMLLVVAATAGVMFFLACCRWCGPCSPARRWPRCWIRGNSTGPATKWWWPGAARACASTGWWHGAAHEEHLARQPMHLLLHACIRDACEQGLPPFDFGPSHGHAGVESFKAAYGGERVACPMLRAPPRARRAPALRALARLVR